MNQFDWRTLESKFERIPFSGCWIWTGNANTKGYGQILISGTRWMAHRMSYTLAHGEIPPGLVVCHRCDVPSCINPDHLFVGKNMENHLDSVAKGRQSKEKFLGWVFKNRYRRNPDFCIRGHLWSKSKYTSRGGSVYCRGCKQLSRRLERKAASERRAALKEPT